MDILQYINYDLLLPLLLYSIGMAIYAAFIWKFYRYLARRDLVKYDIQKYSKAAPLKGFMSFILATVKYIILVPISTFLWFAVLAAFLLFMAKNQPISQILLISMAIVAATRITAYYHEELSKDLAKMLPFAILGIFIVDRSFFSIELVAERFKELPSFLLAITNYIAFAVILEFILRVLHLIANTIRGEDKTQ